MYRLNYRIRCGSPELTQHAEVAATAALEALNQIVDVDRVHPSDVEDDEITGWALLHSSGTIEPGWADKSFEALVSLALGQAQAMIEVNTHEAKEEETAS